MTNSFLYDYLQIYSDENYTKKVKNVDIEQFFTQSLVFKKISNLRFSKIIYGESVTATGILADSNGGYAFETLEGVEEINLIEIDIPLMIDSEIETEILEIANAIASKYSWIIEERR
ncbi:MULTISPECIES: hypothetical protein [Paenibacillus]|jgi:hypothetical protein|uniref:hypothetical protein n=1 Tax=Paenibacillus TaxID=44249 RepID=UPI0009A88FB6|nr:MULTISPECIES: hypothetical protein [Paenibacillus]MCZ1265969.1 hypothetical protein [Paenibacillus tundrae]SLK12966.1 hypothetical protein SAMN06272722_10827 [Paenibacillus sp. RU5A]SOC72804.1 hypothetical protein SAMN05880581_10827 [Paenibacillus sp. RU26A]SOC75060.1 hypothetical protein SAMN05880586_10827 [Paenibacillus sp. RU5M]